MYIFYKAQIVFLYFITLLPLVLGVQEFWLKNQQLTKEVGRSDEVTAQPRTVPLLRCPLPREHPTPGGD